jgi:geranylgeranyl reductase family protein
LADNYDVIVVGGGPAGATGAMCCARSGFRVLLLEKMVFGRHKVCGGVLPLVAPDIIEQIVQASIPADVMSDPPQLGLTYVPPSGKVNGGRLTGYTVHNIDRDRFDMWMIDLALDAGAEVLFSTKLTSFREENGISVHADSKGRDTSLRTRFLIGADGVRSTVRKCLFPDVADPVMIVGQEVWHGTGDYSNDFYELFKGSISPACSYLIPKHGQVFIGTGVLSKSEPTIAAALRLLRTWLKEESIFVGNEMVGHERWAIPFGNIVRGKGNVILAGDAAGLCNPLSGEGIRLAVESGEAASISIEKHFEDKMVLEEYVRGTSGLSSMVRGLYEFVVSADDTIREGFVRTELTRRR